MSLSGRPMNVLRNWWRRWRTPLSLGQRGERAAARFLQRQGFLLVSRGDRSGLGEIDLVAVDGRTVVFVEVKTRHSDEAGSPAEAVDRHKQRRLTQVAQSFLRIHGLTAHRARFDVVAVTWPDGRRAPTIVHLRNAFDAVEAEPSPASSSRSLRSPRA